MNASDIYSISQLISGASCVLLINVFYCHFQIEREEIQEKHSDLQAVKPFN